MGELDLSSARALESRIDLLERGGAHAIVLDLRGVSFIDMAGLRALLRSQERCREHGRSFCCRVHSNGPVWRLLELVESLERAEHLSRDTLSSLMLETAPVF